MSQHFGVFNLDSRENLFKDRGSYLQFVGELSQAAADPESTLLLINSITSLGSSPVSKAICGIISIASCHEIFSEIIKAKLDDPKVVNSIVEFLSKEQS